MKKKKITLLLCGLSFSLVMSSFCYKNEPQEIPMEVMVSTVEPPDYVGNIPVVAVQTITTNAVKESTSKDVDDEFAFIEDIAEQYGLDTELVHAIIMVESNYDSNAVSSANCLGLMQISPKWHADRMERLGVTDLFDPYGNVLVGCDYLSELLEDYDLEFALMIYNQGLDSATRTYQSSGQSGYSKKVMNNYYELLGENNG